MIAAILAAMASVAPTTIQFGVSSLVPPEPLPLGGYTERGDKSFLPGGDEIQARALVLRSGDLRLAIVSADLLTIPESLAASVRNRLPQGTAMFLSATHTHCAPDSQMTNSQMTFAVPGIAKFNQRWLDWMSIRIAASVDSALREVPRRADEARLTWWSVHLNRARRSGGIPSKLATEVRFGDASIVSYAAHPVIYGPEELRLRRDFPGAIATGRSLFLPGAIGDVSPAVDGQSPEERIKRFAEEFWRSKARADSAVQHMRVKGPIRFVTEPIRLDAVRPHPEFAGRYNVPAPLAGVAVSQFAPRSAEITAFRIGKLAVIGVPGEPTAGLGRRIAVAARGLGFEWPLVVSHVNGWIGYILEPWDYDRGGYEATLSFHGRETGQRVYEACVAALRRLRTAR